MKAVAKLNNSPIAPRKMRLIADAIRGKDVFEAMNILKYSSKAASGDVEKLVLSAINNWSQANEGLKPEDSELYVKEVMVDQGRTLKRFRPAPFGRAYRVRKRSNHFTVIVDSKIVVEETVNNDQE